MDPAVKSAAEALAAGDPLAALQRVALRTDAPSLALRGIAMAQLGELPTARKLLAQAARGFGEKARVPRARCIVAAAEVALTARDLKGVGKELDDAARVLRTHGDVENARFAELLVVRRALLTGRLADAERRLAALAPGAVSPRLASLSALVQADVLLRRVRVTEARKALGRALAAARAARIPPLLADVERALRELDAPAARLRAAGSERQLRLEDVEALESAPELVIDACRREVRAGATLVSLVSRPVLLALAVTLGEAAPGEAARLDLLASAFAARAPSDSLRARLRVEIGRLRKVLSTVAEIRATPDGFALVPRGGRRVAVLLPPSPDEGSAIAALLGGGESWSTSTLAAAVGKSQRAVQRALSQLEADGKVQSVGRGRARRWVAPTKSGFATLLLLVAREPPG